MAAANSQFVVAVKRFTTQYDLCLAIGGLFEAIDLSQRNQNAAMNAHELIGEFLLQYFLENRRSGFDRHRGEP